ncbi:replication restart helicase PriA [Desulfurobacterium atlanticum]|uniref:Replication restart protein PriA n=1 Tax=Desulfurobacterium atlanticum TaxID=240169 RepID=A0A238YV80_9BACT|nr:primosomal protein N' [Desulfurobacterium atlanticum]SNR75186.1 replication restart DNA helicase PriA [Desulfurobacterium atlanticum]
MYAEVALNIPIDKTFVYRVPENLVEKLEKGKRVIVPFGRKDFLKTGIITDIKEKTEVNPSFIKEIFDIPDSFPLFTENTLKLAEEIAKRYASGIGETLFFFLPSGFIIDESTYIYLIKDEKVKGKTERDILNFLKEKKGKVKLVTLNRRIKGSVYQAVKNLIRKGLIGKEEAITYPSLPSKKFVSLLKEETVRGAKEKLLIELLKEKKEISVDEIKKSGIKSHTIKRLQEKGIIEIFEKEILLDIKKQELEDKRKITLTSDQKKAFEKITNGKNETFLLYGVTGSGKMEVYLNAAREIVNRGKSVLILVPELLLTPELRARVESYFGENIAVFHSKLSKKELTSQWIKAIKGTTKVFIGTRMALMLPIKDLGLIVVDEEQDVSYKEQQKPLYHARDMAIKRGKIENCPVVLVSATPSVESYYKGITGEYIPLELKKRISEIPLPYIKVVNLSEEKKVGIFSQPLITAIKNTIKKGEQVLLFINRRGFFSSGFCPECGFVAECNDCAVPLVYHKSVKKLICHICGKTYKPVYRCPKCKTKLEFKGYGTERVEEEAKVLFPEGKIIRLDQDSVKDPIRGAKLISDIKKGKYNIIIGTQIASKGHNFPKLTLVAVLLADVGYLLPDFRSSERVFQTIVHTTGRAGRFKPGAAIVQAFEPENPAVKYAREYRFELFYKEEIEARKIFNYPPFSFPVLLEFQLERSSKFKTVESKFNVLKEKLSPYFNVPPLTPAPIPKIAGRYRFTSFLRASSEENLIKGVNLLKNEMQLLFKGIRYKIDVEPVYLL